ncbi:hypothetical protein ACFWM0_14815 [Streptomyces sp. NPDC058405]|uniref:hypothetical protein n=1 Tax=Streptomyces sp. NPDC058405 TaxID=3346482 RepID=UPI0036467087
MPWISRTRLAALRAQIERLTEQRDEARMDAAAHLGAAKRTAARNVHLADQAETATVGRLSAALTAETRRADQLQRRLDNALGLDRPDVAAGAGWQARRTDKPKPGPGVKP